MKAQAKCWINDDGTWRRPGEVFTVKDIDVETMTLYVEPVTEQTETTINEPDEPARRGRKRKVEE